MVHAAELACHPIPRDLAGQLCEHLGANIYNGMDAQVLRNPTFADYPFATGQTTPDGVVTFQFERERIESELRRQAVRCGWPEEELRGCATAAGWIGLFLVPRGAAPGRGGQPRYRGPRAGGRSESSSKPAVEGSSSGPGCRCTERGSIEFELLARSPGLTALKLSLKGQGGASAVAEAKLTGLLTEWRKLTGAVVLGEDSRPDAPCCLVLSSESAGQLVVGHLFLRPADHIGGADPDVVRLLKEAHLPLLRWPGGNFVSAYHWQDGVGPVEGRPTLPNYAWGGVEPNTFGTDEFIGFCRAVGCEPMICVNGGTGTPEEAARWVEYCNGPPASPMGARRAANGHPGAYNVRHWEVGNELWGRWQAHWTTASGYVDRYQRFAQAMLKADPTIELAACGAPVMWGKAWNDTLIAGLGAPLHSITDHPLIGGVLPPATDPLDVFRDFMRVPDVLERKWSELRQDMARAGVRDGRLAVTELQMFARLAPGLGGQGSNRLNPQNLVNPFPSARRSMTP